MHPDDPRALDRPLCLRYPEALISFGLTWVEGVQHPCIRLPLRTCKQMLA